MAMTAEEHAGLPTTTYRHLERIARLAYIDPAIVRAILAGSQPRHLSARALWRMASLPLLWGAFRGCRPETCAVPFRVWELDLLDWIAPLGLL